ncbi:MAG TPA: hypothetical protein VKS98_06810, partial [Chthoniobacterales bacterium]|nr:hypothetical protein [Chthoniobacterales bacterium]
MVSVILSTIILSRRNNFLDGGNIKGQKEEPLRRDGIVLEQNHLKFLGALICTAAMSIFASPVFAQSVSTSPERADVLQPQTQPFYGASPDGFVDGHAIETPNDPDIGQQELVRPETQYQPFSFSIGTPVFYTSNVALTPHNEKGDVVFAPVVAFFYDPQIARNLYAHLGAREQVFYYGKYSAFNFGSLDCEAGLSYFLPQLHDVVLRAWYDFNRLTLDDRLGDEFFSDHRIILNAEIPFRFGRAQQITVGADANLSVGADHQFPRRNDYEEYIAYSAGLTRSFSVQAVGRFVVRDYHQNGRNDISEIISAAATYRLNNLLSISAISSYAHNDSNQDVFD